MDCRAKERAKDRVVFGALAFLFPLSLFLVPTLVPAFASAAAKEIRFKEIPLEVREGDRLVVSLLRGSVRLSTPAPGKPAVVRARKRLNDKASSEEQARFEALAFTTRRDGQVVYLEIKGPENTRSSWLQWMRSATPELHLEIEAPSSPSEITLREGQINVQNWRQALTASVNEGQIRSTGGEGLIKAQSQKGEIRIEKHRGRVEADSYGAKVIATEIEGDIHVTNFAGETNLSKTKGHVQLLNHAGNTALVKSSGSLQFLNGRGALNVQGFEGPIRGHSDQGAVVAVLEGESEAEVDMDSVQAQLTVRLPANSGAQIQMQSEEGSVVPPETIRALGGSGTKTASGRLNGSGPKGSVSLKSKSGALRMR